MYYDTELQFFQQILKNMNVHVRILNNSLEQIPECEPDLGLRHLLAPDTDTRKILYQFPFVCEPNKIYRILDDFLCSYILFQLPDTKETPYVLIGPYTLTAISQKDLLDISQKFSLTREQLSQLEKYYHNLVLIPHEGTLLSILNALGERLWGSIDNFSLVDVENSIVIALEPIPKNSVIKKTEDPFLSMKILEERYAMENQLILAVSQGQAHKAEMLIGSMSSQWIERRIANPVQNLKNYLIICNTLLRKAAEHGAVHPLYIDSLSSSFAYKIETILSVEAGISLMKEIVRKYCLLVKNHSVKNYSLLIRKVMIRINTDLTADLSLKTQAQLLNVNSSYLSSLFKKETGMPLTEYVNRKRVEYALFLLNSTNMQIQTIAQQCGVPDVNYFTKIFKKLIGKTPKEYRSKIQ